MKNKIKKWFIENYSDLYEAMKNCSHTHTNGIKNIYHLEEDCWTHTEMVMNFVSDDTNQIFAALLHDIGKVFVRREKKNGKVSFFQHANVSMVKSIDILKHAVTAYNVDILLVLKLVAWHGTLWNKIPIETKLKNIDHSYGHQLQLYKQLLEFAEADAYGREFDETVATEELDYLDGQFQHLSNYIPFNHHQYIEKRSLEAVFLVGISGSGKSTFLEHFELSDYVVISVDKFFESKHRKYDSFNYKKTVKKAYAQCIKELESAVKNKQNIVIDMTNLTKETRFNKLKRIPTTQYNHSAVVFLEGEKKIKENLEKRDGKHLSYDIIYKQIQTFELPNYDEFYDIQYKLARNHD